MSKNIRKILIVFVAAIMAISLTACAGMPLTSVNDDNQNNSSENNVSNIQKEAENNTNDGSSSGLPQNAEGDTYVATFESYGGTAVRQQVLSVIEVSPTTTFTGYTFAGWYLMDDLTGDRVVFPYTLTKNTTFYAKWETNGVKEIVSIDDLKSVSNAMAGKYKLMTDLDLRSVDWMPLGMSFTKEEEAEKVSLTNAIIPFTGTFDGNGKTIYNLTLIPKGPEEQFNYLPYGLFSALGTGGVIQNLNINSYRIHLDASFSDFYLASLVGQMKGGLIQNCTAIGTINNPELVYEGSILDDFLGSYATPTANTFIGGLIGGILGGTVESCNSGGTILSESVGDGVFVGGLAGFNWDGTIRKSYSYAKVTGRYAGNLVGYNNGILNDCWATGESNGSMSYPAVAGGLSAYNDINGRIERCYSTGEVRARTAGGLVGINMFNYSKIAPLNIAGDPIMQAANINNDTLGPGTGGIIKNCYSTSNVYANEYAGGLIGRVESNLPINGKEDIKSSVTNDFYFISYCFSYGNVRAIAEELAYKDENGRYLITSGVYHSVYAGGLIGHAMEVRILSCIAFGNVIATSKRPAGSDDSIYNEAFANNAIGQSSNAQGVNINTHEIAPIRLVFGAAGQSVTRNGNHYTDFNTVEALPYSGNNGRNVNSVSFLTGILTSLDTAMGFDSSVWNFNNIKIEDGRRPILY